MGCRSSIEERREIMVLENFGSLKFGRFTVPNVFFMVSAIGLVGCASHSGGFLRSADERRLEVLTSFSTALNAKYYQKAVWYLCQEDQMKILNAAGEVPPGFREKLRALKLSTLNGNPSVEIVHGKIDGLYELLPVLDQGPASNSGIDVSVESELPAGAAQSNGEIPMRSQAELKAAAEKFFESVRVRHWSRALDYLDEREKTVFEKGNGKLRIGTRRRLAAVDTASWDALTLKDGKLTGLVLIVPPLSSLDSHQKPN
jgi:hypothetical protein